MTGGAGGVELGPCDPVTLHPDLDWLEARCGGGGGDDGGGGGGRRALPPKMVVLVNPCNPTGEWGSVCVRVVCCGV